MINKKLVHFNNKTTFEEQNDAGNILETSIVFVKDSNEIYTHGAEYQWVGWSYLINIPTDYSLFETKTDLLKDADNEYFVILE